MGFTESSEILLNQNDKPAELVFPRAEPAIPNSCRPAEILESENSFDFS